MPVRRDHKMAAGVGVFVHDDKGVRTTVQHKAFFILASVVWQAENAGVGLRPKDIINTPRRPENFHAAPTVYATSVHALRAVGKYFRRAGGVGEGRYAP